MSAGASFTLGRLADALGASLVGDATRVVTGVAPLEIAGPEDVSFLTDRKYLAQAAASRAGALLVAREVSGLPGALLQVDHPQQALIALLELFHPQTPPSPGVHPSACVAESARIDRSASVAALAVVEAEAVIGPRSRVGALSFVGARAALGEDVRLYPRVVVREGVRIGNRVVVHPGAVLGADGFGYAFDGRAHRKIPQVGGLRIEDDVEIGANTAIDRATLGETVVRRGTKIDNLVQIGHNCDVGEDVILVSQVGIAGSSKVGDRAMLAGQVGVADHVTIGAGAILTAKSGVPSDVPAGEVWGGLPSRPVAETRRIWASEKQLPELIKRVRALEKRVRELEERRA
ncbi:MAG TPA: UDP-3-O-(3-hydroxymyristoyl)glucosamine N-acyltransferase [Methylomirabilota bacterium]|nr:UDP-3-O-(3-hydroxymyristoyl)glucosamine N-acyltransferase [Methylomirabilota bacterium]